MTPVERACRATCLVAAVATSFTFQLSTAHAQSAEAEALFRDGRDLIRHGKLAAGCDKLDASEQLESSIGTLLNLGDCRDKLGKSASAWAAFRKAEAMAKRAGGDDKRQLEASRRATQLEAKLSKLVIDVPARVEGLVIRRDGEVVAPAVWNTPLPVDPGSYALTAEAPGFQPWRIMVVVSADTKRQSVTVPRLEPLPVAPPPEPAAVPAPIGPSTPVAPPRAVVRPAGTWSTTRAVSAVLGVAGAGALGTGIYFGLHARDLQDRADRRCPLAACADPEALRWNDDARSSASRANILYIAGGASIATAVVLWLVGAPEETVVVPTAGDRQMGISLTGSF